MENEFIDKAQLDEKEAAEAKEKEERVAKRKKAAAKKSNTIVQILNGDFFTREFVVNNLGFIFFVMLLLLLIVGKGYYGKQLLKDVSETQQELDELTSDYFEAKARLEEETRRTHLVEELSSRGLKETVNPTKVIRMKKKKESNDNE